MEVMTSYITHIQMWDSDQQEVKTRLGDLETKTSEAVATLDHLCAVHRDLGEQMNSLQTQTDRHSQDLMKLQQQATDQQKILDSRSGQEADLLKRLAEAEQRLAQIETHLQKQREVERL